MPDPDDASDGDDAPDPEAIRSVAEVATHVKRIVEADADLHDVWIRGEISGISRYDRHMYFTLKEEVDGREHTISGVAFNYRSLDRPEEMADGDEVLVRGDVGIYTPRSQYQVKAREFRAAGEGELYKRFLELKKKLDEEGLFDDALKRDLPPLPRTVGIVTSGRGAALRDIVDVARRRFPNVDLLLAPTAVQGPQAAGGIAEAIRRHDDAKRADIVIVGRGGGSLEDLWAFNEETVARAIVAADVPIVSAVGHETDVTIADLVADARAPTPSAAAELVVPVKADLVEQVETGRRSLARRVQGLVTRGRERLDAVRRRTGYQHPRRIVEDREQRLDDLRRRLGQGLEMLWTTEREAYGRTAARLDAIRPVRLLAEARRDLVDVERDLVRGGERLLTESRSHLVEATTALESLSPLGVLDRGYTVVQRPDGTPVTRAGQTAVGATLDVRFADGTARTQVEELKEDPR